MLVALTLTAQNTQHVNPGVEDLQEEEKHFRFKLDRGIPGAFSNHPLHL